MAYPSALGDRGPHAARLLKPPPDLNVKIDAHGSIIAKFCFKRKRKVLLDTGATLCDDAPHPNGDTMTSQAAVEHYESLASQAAALAEHRYDDFEPAPAPMSDPVVDIEQFSDELAANCMTGRPGRPDPLTVCPRLAVLSPRLMRTYSDADLLSVALMAADDRRHERCTEALRELMARFRGRHADDKPCALSALVPPPVWPGVRK